MLQPEMDSVSVEKPSPIIIKEGKAEILFSTQNEVFYNKVQEFNRDLTVTALNCFHDYLHSTDVKVLKYAKRLAWEAKNKDNDAEGSPMNTESPDMTASSTESAPIPPLKILEALGASGLRSIRFAKEIPGAGKITCNDLTPAALEAMERNFSHNNVTITKNCEDACMLMQRSKNEYDAIDLDPYGSPTIFLDTAVGAVRSGGVLCVTATDLGVLTGNHIQACYGKYGGMPMKRPYCHEFALRLLLSCVDSHANRHGRYIKPLLSYKADFYIRVFVQVFQSQKEVQRTSLRRSYVYDCVGCHSYHLQPVGRAIEGTNKITPGRGPPVGQQCGECGKEFYIGGPIWSDPIHDLSFVQHMLDRVQGEESYLGTVKRIRGTLSVILEELTDSPLFYELSFLSKTVHSPCPPTAVFRSAILNSGYKVSFSHVAEKSIKTDAPPSVIWDIMRAWAVESKVKVREEGTVGGDIMRKESTHTVSFALHPDAVASSQKQALVRYAPNPEPEWGPKARAGKRKTLTKDKANPCKKPSQDLKMFECRRHERGECELGENCKYTHKDSVAT